MMLQFPSLTARLLGLLNEGQGPSKKNLLWIMQIECSLKYEKCVLQLFDYIMKIYW